jgi:hypothetical protein
MARTLALAYLLSVAALVAMIALGRGALAQLDGHTAIFYTSLIGLLMLPAAALFFRGAGLSRGRLRKSLAYGLSAVSAFIGLGSAVAVILVVIGAANPG